MIKSYTDLEQSKKLAEFLPPESADMSYYFMKDSGRLVNLSPFVLDGTEVRENGMFTYLNCWSLAALSEFILPYIADDDGNNYKFYLSKDGLDRWVAYYKSDDVSIHICEESDNMIDVIFEMICWLKTEKYI